MTGLGLGGALPMLLALVSESARADRQSASVAMVYAGTPFGGALVSLLSLVIASAQWRWIFWIGGLLPLLLTPFLIRGLRESEAFQRVAARADLSAASMPKRGSFAAIFADGRAVRTILLWMSFFLGLLLLYLLLNWLPTLMVNHGLTRTQAATAQIGFNTGAPYQRYSLGI